MSVLVIDAHGAGVTAAVVSSQGVVLGKAQQSFHQHVPEPGWLEHAPEEIWQATLGATREVLTKVNDQEVTSIGVTNQRDTLVVWDRETLGLPRRAIAGQDRRTAEICTSLRDHGHEARVRELTGLRIDPSCAGTKLMWLAEHEPHTWALVVSGRYATGTLDSYLIVRMTRGTWHVTDVSNASRTLLLDLRTGDWSDELCRLFAVPRDALPDLVPTWGEVAPSEPSVFAGLSLPIAGIAGHQQAALFGQACFEEGAARCAYGSQSHLITNTGATIRRGTDGSVSTAAWRAPDGGLTLACEGALDATDGTDESLEAVASEVRCLVEGMSQAGQQITSLRVDGAAAASDALCQLQADQLGLPVERPKVLDTTTVGAAFLAGLGTGLWDSTEVLREIWSLDRRFDPSGPAL